MKSQPEAAVHSSLSTNFTQNFPKNVFSRKEVNGTLINNDSIAENNIISSPASSDYSPQTIRAATTAGNTIIIKVKGSIIIALNKLFNILYYCLLWVDS